MIQYFTYKLIFRKQYKSGCFQTEFLEKMHKHLL